MEKSKKGEGVALLFMAILFPILSRVADRLLLEDEDGRAKISVLFGALPRVPLRTLSVALQSCELEFMDAVLRVRSENLRRFLVIPLVLWLLLAVSKPLFFVEEVVSSPFRD